MTSTTILLLILLLILCGMALALVPAWRETRGHARTQRMTRLAAIALIVVGAVGYFGIFVAASGGMNWLPATFELPAGRVSGVVAMADGTHVVPLDSAGRVQLYDSDWRFQRGWQLDAGGGTFVVDALDDGTIQVVTARMQRRYVFDRDGRLLSSGPRGNRDFARFGRRGRTEVVPTHPLLWVWSGPFASWLAFVAGIALIAVADKIKPRKARAAGDSG